VVRSFTRGEKGLPGGEEVGAAMTNPFGERKE